MGSNRRDTSDENDRLVRSFLQAWERRDTEFIVGCFAENGVYHSMPLSPIVGREAIREWVAGFERVPPGRLEIHRQIASDHHVMNERTDSITINNRPVVLRICGVFDLEDGMIAAWREYFDLTPAKAAFAAP